MKECVKRNPAIFYFVITFLISWSGVLIVASQTGIPATTEQFDKLLPLAMIPFLFGPSISGLVLISITKGKEGFKSLFRILFNWRLKTSFYLIAIFTIPLLSSLSLLILSQFSDVYIPDIITTDNKTGLIISGLIYGIIGGGLLEELGWTGFAVPRLRERYSIFKTGLIVGLLWGVWHFLPVIWGCGDSAGNLVLYKFLPGFFFHYAGLIPTRILMVWLYDKSSSLILPIVVHATLTAFTFFILNISEVGIALFNYYLSIAIGLWMIVILIQYKCRK